MAATVVSQSNSEGIVNLAILRVTTDAVAAVATTFQIGFLPRYVRVINITALGEQEWFEGMAADTALNRVAAGTFTLLASGGITVAATTGGGSITLAAAIIPISATFNIMAEG